MKTHADSQLTDAETADRLVAALGSNEHRSSRHLVEARAVGSRDLLMRTSTTGPLGDVHQVSIVEVVTGEPVGFDMAYGDEIDATAVFRHLSGELYAEEDAEALRHLPTDGLVKLGEPYGDGRLGIRLVPAGTVYAEEGGETRSDLWISHVILAGDDSPPTVHQLIRDAYADQRARAESLALLTRPWVDGRVHAVIQHVDAVLARYAPGEESGEE